MAAPFAARLDWAGTDPGTPDHCEPPADPPTQGPVFTALTWAWGTLAGFGLSATPFAIPAPHLGHWGVAETDACDVADSTGHRA